MKFIICVLFVGSVCADSSRIAGGELTTIQQYPFATSLLSNYGSGAYNHVCGGTIITRKEILSAASCFHTNASLHPIVWWRARIGTSSSNSGGLVHSISNIIPHRNFSTTTLDNDIAVLKTTWPMEYSPSVQPAKLAGGAYTLNTNEELWAIGWGKANPSQPVTTELQHVQFWVVNKEICTSRYEELDFEVTSNMVCAGWLDVGVRGQCQGDAGSPLLQNGVVVGVFSWAEGCAQGSYPAINTRISPYIWWIFQQTTA